MNFLINALSDLPAIAAQIITAFGDQKIILFYGDMGAGKTTLIKALCHELGVTDNVASPTFSIVNEYRLPLNKIYHFDFYRLKSQTEALDMGYEEYFYSGDYCFVEWPQLIPDLLPNHYVSITVKVLSNDEREVTLAAV
jgi:tRNA threonylcarbamoyladenosine biosynthesis protein TsaE